MIIDPHIHSTYSGDSSATVEDIINYSKKIGLDAIAIADHNSIKGSIKALEQVGNDPDFLIIPSMEISTGKGHIVALGVTDEISAGLSPEETISIIHDHGGIAVAAHPFVHYREGLFTQTDYLDVDAIETLNSRYIFGFSNWRAKKLAEKKNIPQIGASDAHFLKAIGSCITHLEAEFTVESVLDCILSGQTHVFGDRTPLPLILKEVINKKIKRI
jgi:predicted metal-dependent phosphoesterase TrpH